MPKASFIVTAYERPAALRTCLSSIVQQTEQNWEVIVVDNSPDAGTCIVNEQVTKMSNRIRYEAVGAMTMVTGQIHERSLYKATDIGVDLATSDWLVFPNDDSYYCPWFLERMLSAALMNAWDLVYCDLIAGGPGGHWLLQARPKLCCIDKTNIMLRRSRYIGWPDAGTDYAQADGLMIEQLVKSGVRHGRVDQALAVHN